MTIFCILEESDADWFAVDLSNNDQNDRGQMISFQLHETYEQLKQFPTQIFLPSLTILLTARLRLTQERIQNLKLEEDNGSSLKNCRKDA